MISYRKAAAVAAVVCAVVVPAVGSAHAATADGGRGQSGEIDRNLIKAPPGGVLAPVANAVPAAGGLLSPK
ncbi:hypothetical protein [Streptomyces sp. NPDC005408]|uniref:hypothetical protein n=1 Tax=Streptomyces sp. NPDC005408 TaxID=3155341 RepID=UPI0033AEB5DC